MTLAKRLVCGALALVCVLLCVVPVYAVEVGSLPDSFYLSQKEDDTCTLCSVTMMLRSAMYMRGDHGWTGATEDVMRKIAWTEGSGLHWSFSYSSGDSVVHVGRQKASGLSVDALKTLLDKYPEGIVLYCGKLPHAVFLMGYEGDTFYCAETIKGYSGEPITLAASSLGRRYGSQAAVLKNVTAYWYVSAYQGIYADTGCDCEVAAAGTYVCTTSGTGLRIRSGHGTRYSVKGMIPAGASVQVLRASDGWAHVIYNGIQGYASMEYLKLIVPKHNLEAKVVKPTCAADGYTYYGCTECGVHYKDNVIEAFGHTYGDWVNVADGLEQRVCLGCGSVEVRAEMPGLRGTITGSNLRIREGAGTGYRVLGYLGKGDRVEILEQKVVGSVTWGRIEKGWISMEYVELDAVVQEPPVAEPEQPISVMGTVTGSNLRIREGAGTGYKTLGYLGKGDRVEVFEQKVVGAMTWGRIENGWICMDYVRLDEVVQEPPVVEPTPPSSVMGTVTGSGLRIREGAGTGYKTLGYLSKGDRVEILEQKVVGSMTWGRIENGWVCMDYIKVDATSD